MANASQSGKKSGLRVPRATEDAPRGLSRDFKVKVAIPQSTEDFTKRFGPLSVEVQQVLTAILMLESQESNIVIDSLNAIQKFCKKRDENKDFYVEFGGLPPIQKRMFDTHTVIQRMSMKVLALASTVHKTKLFIRNEDLAKDLLMLTEVKDDIIVEYATCVLSHFATLHTGRLHIVQQNGVPMLAGLLNHGDPDIQRNAMETLWQISADPLHIGLITNRAYTEAILNLVNSEYPPLQAMALLTLERIACKPEGIANLESLNSITILAKKLTNETMVDLHRHCLKIFFHQCFDRETCRKYAFLAPAIVELIERTPDPLARINGMELLGRLCSLELVAQALAESGFSFLLYTFFTHPELDIRIKEVCAFTTAQIARAAYFSKKEFAKCLPVLLSLVENSKTSRKGLECSLVAISSILEDTINSITEFNQAKGFDTLKTLLEKAETFSDDAVLSALCSIDILAANPTQRMAVVQADYLSILLKFIQEHKDPQVQAVACGILNSILCENATRREFSRQNGPEMIIRMIGHDEFPVVTAAVSIINVASTDPVLGKQMLDSGLLQAMWKRTDLVCRNGPLRTAFDRLISTNTSLKYSITGHVSPFERLSNGFHDMGGLKKLENLKYPQDLIWQTRNPKQKVLFLNLEPMELDAMCLENNESLRVMQERDQDLQDVIESIRNQRHIIDSEPILVKVMAKVISDRFGGPLDKWRFTANAEDLEIENLQNIYKSVIIPISFLTTGAFRTRAIVFKAVCDIFGLPCSLETGDYKKTWNVVLLRPDASFPLMCPCQEDNQNRNENVVYTDNLRRFVVDLVYQPGSLLPLGSFEADTYTTS